MGRRTVTHLADASGVSTGQVSVFDTRTLFDAQVEVLGRLGFQFDTLILAGRLILGNTFQLDDASRAEMLRQFQTNATWPITWITKTNASVLVSQANFTAGCKNINDYYQAMKLNARTHKNAIATLADIPSCDAYDVTTGWPP